MALRSSDNPAAPPAAYSFSAASGPLPTEVVEDVAAACRSWRGGGSALSLPFTSPVYRELQAETETCLRRLLDIPARYRVLFMQGGASAQFAIVPLNLAGDGRRAAYVDTGHWSRRAIAEAERHVGVDIAARGAGAVPAFESWRFDARSAYCHITSNETADGVQFRRLPALPVPLVADLSSDFLTRPLDFTRLALGYAATQKTIGVPGLTVVIVRDDLLDRAHCATPRVMSYAALAEADSRVNTPPVFAILVAHRMLHWIERQGGVDAMERASIRRSAEIYGTLDGSGGFYRAPVAAEHRSRINPCFQLADEALTERLLAEAAASGADGLRGHPQVGGLRVSLYNGVDDRAVTALAGLLGTFARRYG